MGVRNIVLVVLLVIVGALALDSFFIVDSRERAILLQFGDVVRADVQPGFSWKLPLAQQVKKFDGRILTLDTPPSRYFTIEKKPLIVDLFVKWRIGEVSKYYTATSGEELRASNVLAERVNEGLRNQIGRRDMHEVISGERDLLMNELTASLDATLSRDVGIQVIDVRVKRIDLPDEVSDAVYDRMNSERQIEAQQYRATGRELALGITADADRQAVVIAANAYRDAELIRGDGDAKAAAIYGDAYSQDNDFYEFYRTISSYREIFNEEGGSLLVIDPSKEEFFKYLQSQQAP